MFANLSKALCLIVACAVMMLMAAGCAEKKTPAPQPSGRAKPAARHRYDQKTQQRSTDPKAQQRFYDIGLQHYSKENYREAREAFLQVIDINPSNALGLKAQENVKKINQILKTLEEIEEK